MKNRTGSVRAKEQSVSHLSSVFSFTVSSEELRRDFKSRSVVVTVRGGGRGSRRRGRRGSGQLGAGHVFIEVSILIVPLLSQLTPPCAGTGVLHL